jgi:hypothetical protein
VRETFDSQNWHRLREISVRSRRAPAPVISADRALYETATIRCAQEQRSRSSYREEVERIELSGARVSLVVLTHVDPQPFRSRFGRSENGGGFHDRRDALRG